MRKCKVPGCGDLIVFSESLHRSRFCAAHKRKWNATSRLMREHFECCQDCGIYPEHGQSLETHHLAYAEGEYFEPKHLTVLCRRCHREADKLVRGNAA